VIEKRRTRQVVQALLLNIHNLFSIANDKLRDLHEEAMLCSIAKPGQDGEIDSKSRQLVCHAQIDRPAH
jgi:hypothetical protein